ncbi:MAG: GNAT family N-acetyltransferase [Clostridium sp.]
MKPNNFILKDIQHKHKYFALCIHPKKLENKIEDLLGKPVDKDLRTCFILKNKSLYQKLNISEEVMKNFQLKSIDFELMNKIDSEMNFCKGYWSTIDSFDKYGLGYCLIQGEHLASVCYSCTVGNNQMELDLETSKESEGMGLGTTVASIFVNNCIKKEMEPIWVCDKNNAASYNLAKKLGFEEVGSYSQYWWCVKK